MSLEIGENKEGKLIAYLFKGPKRDQPILYLDNDETEIPEGERLKRIRLNLKDETFFPSITEFDDKDKTKKQVDRIYVTGESGCGKSSWIRNYSVNFHRKYPKAKLYLYSSKKEDEMLDNLKYIERVIVDNDILVDHWTLNEIASKSKPSLCIFDDIQDFGSDKLNKEVARFRDEVMRNGRSKGIFSLFVWHDPCDYVRTKHMLFECNKCVIFPKQCGKGAFDYLMKNKMHLTKPNIKMINELKSNYVCICKGVPRMIISDKYIILDQ